MATKRVLAIAELSRQWTEKYARRRGDDEDTLSCYCAIASGKFWLELDKAGIKSVIISNKCHAFNVVSKEIIDLTAAQFDEKHGRIVIAPVSNCGVTVSETWDYWNMKHTSRTLEEFRLYQKKECWPGDQWARNPETYERPIKGK